MLEPGTQPAELIVRDSILGENLKGDSMSSGIMQFLEYCKSVSHGVLPPTTKPFDHLKRLSELESQIKAVWKLKTEESLDDYERRQAYAFVVLKGFQTFIKVCIDIMMSLVLEVEPHLQYWRAYSNFPRTIVHRCLIYNYIEPKWIGKKMSLPQMAYSNLTYLKAIRSQLIHHAGKFLRLYWRLQCVDDFPNQNEGEQFETFLKETYLLLALKETDMSKPLDFRNRLDIPNLFDLILQTVSNAKLFFMHIDRSVQGSRKPHHLSRYFFLYAAGIGGSFTFSALGLGLNSTIEKILHQCWSWSTTLLVKHVSRPARWLFRSILSPKQSKMDSSAVDDERAQLEEMIRQYTKGSTNYKYAQSEELDMNLLVDKYAQDINDNRMNRQRLFKGLLIWMQAGKLQNYETRQQMDEIIDANEVTIWMISLVPVSILAYNTFSILKRGYQGRSLDMLTYKYRFRRLILNLHSLILSLKDQSSKEADKIVGNVLLSCERLRILSYKAVHSSACYHNPKDNMLLEEDLRLFLDFDYDMNQRLRQLARMDRFYM